MNDDLFFKGGWRNSVKSFEFYRKIITVVETAFVCYLAYRFSRLVSQHIFHRMKSGPLGGDQQIGAMLANGELGLIIFLRDPLTAQPHEPDVSALLRLCDVQKIPLATNASSAIIMLEALKNKTFPMG